jgi:hypothetical protein
MAITLNGTSGIIGAIGSQTAQSSTSGTSIDFTGIPAGVKRVTVMFSGVSTNGSSQIQIQLGAGSYQATGYESAAGYTYTGGGSITSASTTGLICIGSNGSTPVWQGAIVCTLLGSNIWVSRGVISNRVSEALACHSSGTVTLSGALDRVRITTVNGTDAFDAGTMNILYE